MNRQQLRALHLAGTVAVPQRFPELGKILLGNRSVATPSSTTDLFGVEHLLNPKLWIRRWFRMADVKAVFLPQDPRCVDLQDGSWLLGEEVSAVLPTLLESRNQCTHGITYVAEQAPTLMQVEVGMTAAESVEYYPPLPDDRTRDHYQLGRPARPAPHHWDPCASRAWDPCSASEKADLECQTHAWDPCSLRLW